MDVFWDSGYGIVLIFWGLVFELGGALMGVVAYRAIQRDQQHANQSAAGIVTESEPPAESVAGRRAEFPRVA